MAGRVTAADARRWAEGALLAVAEARRGGATSLQEIANALNDSKVTALHGGAWSSMQVWRLLRQHPLDAGPLLGR